MVEHVDLTPYHTARRRAIFASICGVVAGLCATVFLTDIYVEAYAQGGVSSTSWLNQIFAGGGYQPMTWQVALALICVALLTLGAAPMAWIAGIAALRQLPQQADQQLFRRRALLGMSFSVSVLLPWLLLFTMFYQSIHQIRACGC